MNTQHPDPIDPIRDGTTYKRSNEGAPSSPLRRFIAFAFVVVLLLVFAFVIQLATRSGVFFEKPSDDTTDAAIQEGRESSTFVSRQEYRTSTRNFQEQLRNKNYTQANTQYQELLSKKTVGSNDRALAVWIGADLPQKASGNTVDAVQSVLELKSFAVDEEIDPFLRAMSINTLGNIYYGSAGRDPRVFEAIFSGEPFESLRVEESAFHSIQNLYEWSYSIQPTAITAVLIARWHVIEIFEHENEMSPSQRAEHIRQAQEFLTDSVQLARQEQVARSVKTETRRYASYLYWGTYVRAALAELGEESNKQTYRDEYQNLLQFLAQSNNSEVQQYIPFARWLFAHFVAVLDEDLETASRQLRLAVEAINKDPKRDVNEFLVFVRNAPTESTALIGENNLFNRLIVEAAERDELFMDFVQSVNPALLGN